MFNRYESTENAVVLFIYMFIFCSLITLSHHFESLLAHLKCLQGINGKYYAYAMVPAAHCKRIYRSLLEVVTNAGIVLKM